MKIIDSWVVWDWNRPILRIVVDKTPDLADLRYTRSDSLWYAELDGYVSFFHWLEKEGDNGGFGSAKYDITMVDGRKKTLLGPWSSRAGALNQRGFGPCVDVDLYANGKAWLVGRAVTLAFAREAIKRCLPPHTPDAARGLHPPNIVTGVTLDLRPNHDEPVWDPALVLYDGSCWHKP